MTTKLDRSYLEFIDDLKNQIKTAKIKAHLAVNRELVLLYFTIGNAILEKIKKEEWGSKVIEKISQDLCKEFPEMKGLSTRNLKYMRQFAELCTEAIGQQPVAQLRNLPFFNVPWGHNVTIMDQDFPHQQSLWYVQETITNGWSRNILMHQIKSDLYSRQTTLNKTHNFDLTLPNPQSDLAANLLKDEYNFEFLRGGDFKEKEVEDQLI